MAPGPNRPSLCRYCRHYYSEGRRGGMCNQLGVPVQAAWSSCALAMAPFVDTWSGPETLARLEQNLALSSKDPHEDSVISS